MYLQLASKPLRLGENAGEFLLSEENHLWALELRLYVAGSLADVSRFVLAQIDVFLFDKDSAIVNVFSYLSSQFERDSPFDCVLVLANF